jgi:phage/plasmid-like protein (TIGR03299 family)
MAHNLATTNDKPAMMYTGEVPWHRLGTRLDQPATAEEAIGAAGLGYQVDLSPLRTEAGAEVTQRKAVVRRDTGRVLGVVGNSYVPVQNHEAFGFLDAVVAEGGLRYHTAGALGLGERIWLLAKLPGQIQVKDSADVVDKFLLLSNTHDGSSALRVFFTPIRVVCQNTLNLAVREGEGRGVAILHKGNLAAKIKEAQRVLGLAVRFYDDAQSQIDKLASSHPSPTQLAAYFKALYPDPEDGKNATRAENVRTELGRLFEEGVGHDQPEIKRTTWAAFNAVTEYVDHHRPARTHGRQDQFDRRLNSIWFGGGARIKEHAWHLALEMANAV